MSAIPHLKLLLPVLTLVGLSLLAIERLVALRSPRHPLLPGLLLNVSISPPAHGSNAVSGSFQSS